MKTEREIAHQMVNALFDTKKDEEDTVIWEEAEINNLQTKRTTYRLTFKKIAEA